ncbi:MAG: tetratricopeptide repeat protein [Salinivirgaceae bacterium]|nr:tetratricopeptide repeat protein [Salinivirgaceae bacterium]
MKSLSIKPFLIWGLFAVAALLAAKTIVGFYAEKLNTKAIATDSDSLRTAYLQRAIAIEKRNPIFYENMAFAYVLRDTNITLNNLLNGNISTTDDLKKAVEYASTACEIDSCNVLFRLNAAILLYLSGNTGKAVQLLQNITDKLALVVLGIIEENNGQTQDARNHYATAIAISPDITDSRFFANICQRDSLMAARIVADAKKQLETEFAETKAIAVQARLGKIMMAEGRTNEARAIFKDVITQLPNMNRPYLYLGSIAEMQRDTAAAINYYETAQKLDEGDLLAIARLNKLKGKEYKEYTNYVRERKTPRMRFRASYIYDAQLLEYICVDGLDEYVSPAVE